MVIGSQASMRGGEKFQLATIVMDFRRFPVSCRCNGEDCLTKCGCFSVDFAIIICISLL